MHRQPSDFLIFKCFSSQIIFYKVVCTFCLRALPPHEIVHIDPEMTANDSILIDILLKKYTSLSNTSAAPHCIFHPFQNWFSIVTFILRQSFCQLSGRWNLPVDQHYLWPTSASKIYTCECGNTVHGLDWWACQNRFPFQVTE